MRRLGAVVIGNIREYDGGSASRRSLGCAVALLAVAVLASGTILSVSEGMPSVPALSMVEISEMVDSGPVTLDGAVAVAVFGTGGGTYAVVAAAHDDGVQIINVTDPSNPVGTGSITDGAGTALDGAYDVAVFGTGGGTYAVVAAVVDDGVQIINVTDPSNPVGTGSITDGAGTALDGASAVAVFGTGGGTYAVVASYREGIQIINVTDPSNPVATAAMFDDDAALLDNARGVDAFRVGGSTYVAVTSRDDSSLGVINVTDPARPVLIAGIRDGGSAATLLGGARGVDAFVTGGGTYAVVAAHGDSGLQLVDISDPSDPSPISSVADGPTLLLKGAASVTTVNIGSAVYALAVSMFESGVQAVDVTDPSNPVPIHVQGAAAPALNGTARDVAVFGVEGAVYAAVATGFFDDSLRILEVVPDDSLGAHTPAPRPVPVSAAYHPRVGAITVVFDGQLGPAVHADRLHVRETGGGEAGLPLSGRPAVEGAVLTITLNAGRSGTIGAMASPVLDIGEGAVYDMYGNPVRTAAGITVEVPDITPPEIVSATYDNSTGRLSVMFSEPLNHTATDHSGLAVLGSSGNITLAAAADRAVLDDDTIAATLDPGQRGMVGASPALRVSGGAVADGSGNRIEPVTVPVRLTANVPPTVDAGPDLAVPEGAIISLNGTATDMDGDTLTYRWSHGPTLAVSFDDPASPSASFRAPQVNVTTTATLTLAVSDGNATVSDSLVLTISDVPENHPPTVDAGPDLSVPEGAIISLNGTATDMDGDTLTYRWSHGPTLAVSFDDPASPSASFRAPQVNVTTTATLTLAVSDGNATVSDSLVLTISDVPENHPPTVDAGPDLSVPEGAIISLNGTATDMDGDTLTYRWSHGPTLAVSFDDPASPSASFRAPQVNVTTTATLTLAVSDGNATVSDSLVLTISDVPENHPPTVDAGPDLSVPEGAIISLNGTATDMDGDALSYRWSHGPTLAVSFDDPASPSASFRAPQVNVTTTATLTLAVSDGNATVSDSLVLTISDVPENHPPTVDAGPDLSVPEGAIVSLNGTATDMDGDALSYRWSHGPTLAVSFDDPASPSASFRAPQVNVTTTATLTLAVSDGNATVSDSLVLTVSDVPENHPSEEAAASLNGTDLAVDTTPPVITLVGGAEVQLAKGATYTEPGYTATDNMDGNVTGMVVVAGSVNTDAVGSYTLSYDVADRAGNAAVTQNRTVTVAADDIPPVITLKGQQTMSVEGRTAYVEPGYAATDNIDGDITDMVVVAGTVNTAILGTYTLSYDVSDSSGNAATHNRTVMVVDTMPPVITLVGAAEVQLAKGATYTEPGYTAADSMDGNVTGRVAVTGSVDVDTLGTYTVSYEIKDGAGNAATEVRTVTVVPDTVPPAITLSGGSSITLPMGPTFTDPGYAATDNIDGEITGRVSITGAVNPLIPGTYAISYGVTDSSGNTERKTRTVTVLPPTDTASYCDGMTLAQLMASGRYNIINKMFSSEPSIAGTNAADLIIAGDNGPTIEGRGGDDCIIGGAGADTLLGLGGDDMIFGKGGDDTIRGGAGHDRLWGQGGADTIYGGQNGDTMYGGAGHDTMYGGAGADTMYGGAGHDQMWGLGGSDTIYGDAGDDTLYGGPGTDALYGGPGTDAIESGENDTVYDDDDDSSGEG